MSRNTDRPARASQKFRDEHVKLHEHLEHVRVWTGELGSGPAAEDNRRAQRILAFFREHIAPHAAWEERALYPLIDRLAGTTERARFTASMRFEP